MHTQSKQDALPAGIRWSRREFLERTTTATAALALAGTNLLAACGSGQQTATAPVGKVVRGGHVSTTFAAGISGFNPVLQPEGAVVSGAISLLLEGLLGLLPNGGLYPQLAQSIPQVSADGKTYTFSLRKGLKWSDGAPLTADDAVFTYMLMYDPSYQAVRSPFRSDLQQLIDQVTAPDPNTVVIKTKTVSASFLTVHGRHQLVPKHLLGNLSPAAFNTHEFNQTPSVASGPFKFLELKSGDHATFVRNDNFRGGPAFLDRYVGQFISKDAATTATKAGDLDFTGVGAGRIDEMKTVSFINEDIYTTTIGLSLYYNLDPNKPASKIFSSKAVRQALLYAADRQGAVKTILFNHGIAPAGTGPYLPGSWAYNADPKLKYATDKQKAVSLLEADGWKLGAGGTREKNGIPLKFEVIVSAEAAEWKGDVAIFQQNWKEIGADVSIRTIPFAQLTTTILFTRDFDVVTNNPLATRSPDPDLSASFHSRNAVPGGSNYTYYKNSTLDQLLDQGVATLDQAKRRDIYLKVQDILNEDVPCWCAQYWQSGFAHNKRVQGLSTRIGPYDFLNRPTMNEVWVSDGK